MTSKDNKQPVSLARFEGMQSVRTTFRLSPKADGVLNNLVKATKSTIKEILDNFAKAVLTDKTWTDVIATAAKKVDIGENSIRKTFVISKTTLTLVSTTAKRKGVPRDALFESLILLAEQLMNNARIQQPEKHKKAQTIINDFWDRALKLETQLKDLLGEDDPVYMRSLYVATILMNLSMAIDSEREKGIPIDPDDIGQQD